MFRLRSIRRKLGLSLALVVAMFLLQGGAGGYGLYSYHQAIQSLERAFVSGPRRSEVLSAIAEAFDPLLWPELAAPEALQLRQVAVRERLEFLRRMTNDFHRKQQNEATTPDVRLLSDTLLNRVDDQLALMLRDGVPRLADPRTAPATADEMRRGLAKLQLTIVSLPRPDHGFEQVVTHARSVYQSGTWIIGGTIVAAFVCFLLVAQFNYRWIFLPIRKLHEGASRVAQGDFRYRVTIPGNDEMAQLAEKFNQMTASFEEIRNQLDRQVHDRTRQALRSEKLAGVGFLASGVAHEINNPLSAIAMAAESLEGRIRDAQDVGGLKAEDLGVLSQYLGMIQRESFRCQQITQRLLDFSRGQDAPRARHDLTRIVSEVLDMVSHMTRFRGHEILFNRSQSVWLDVRGSEIKQVVLNMVANALESMSGNGRLEIQITELADEVVLQFTDTGCGMTPHVLENLFEPFFTEKQNGRGTGLGLSISHRIVTDHGGQIEAHSDGPGLGSTFRVHLPRRVARAAAA